MHLAGCKVSMDGVTASGQSANVQQTVSIGASYKNGLTEGVDNGHND